MFDSDTMRGVRPVMTQGQSQKPITDHRLALTPSLRQSLAILQMPAAELQEYIGQQLLDNCTLETVEDEESDQGRSELAGDDEDGWELAAYLADPDGAVPAGTIFESEVEDPGGGFDRLLTDYLLFQLHTAGLTAEETHIGEFIIGNLDDDGYLLIGSEEIARSLGVVTEEIERVLAVIRNFDPAGVGAGDLSECLILQLPPAGDIALDRDLRIIVVDIIQGHLASAARGEVSRIAGLIGRSPKDVQRALDYIRRLDPKPGAGFGRYPANRSVMPDATVRKAGRDYVVLVNEAPGARLRLNPVYQAMAADGENPDPETARFLKGRISAALWLLRCLERRRMTLLKIAETILLRQKDFFDRGALHLRPLTLRQVAEAVGLHESTVSRALAGKYLETPRGIFEFKYFFAAGLETVGGEAVAADSAMKLIREAIQGEDSGKPLSDQDLSQALTAGGILVSRRTVAKYREAMAIPPSHRRRRF